MRRMYRSMGGAVVVVGVGVVVVVDTTELPGGSI